MPLVRKRNLSRVTPFYFRSRYGAKLSKTMVEAFNAKKQDASEAAAYAISVGKSKGKSKKSKKLKVVKQSKPGFVFLFNKNIVLPSSFSKKRISIYNGKVFSSFIVKLKYVYTRLAEFISTKKFGRVIHKKPEKKVSSKRGQKKK